MRFSVGANAKSRSLPACGHPTGRAKPPFDQKGKKGNLRGRESFRGETVPEGISPTVPWDQLEKKRKVPAKVKSIREKLHVPRHRFHLTSDGRYLWAGKQ